MSVGVIGFGARSGLSLHAHDPEGRRGPASRVTIVCDVSPRGRAEAETCIPGVVVTEDVSVVLDSGLDAVMILTPDDQHVPVALRCLEAGVATFCEKPLATTIEDCDRILVAARSTGTRLYVGHNMRHMPVVTQLAELIRAGTIGEVRVVWCRHFVGHGGDFYFKDWHADRRRSTGLLLQKGAHDLDVIHWLAGGYTRDVVGMGDLMLYGDLTDRLDRSDQRMQEWYDLGNWPPASQRGLHPVVDVEDVSMMQMRLDNGVLASYQQCHFTPDYWRNYTVIGTAGRLENLGDGPGGQIHLWNRRHDAQAAPDEVIEITGQSELHGGADPLLVAEFLRFAVAGGRTQTSPVAARQAVAAGVMATESIRNGSRPRRVPPLDRDLVAYFDRGQREP